MTAPLRTMVDVLMGDAELGAVLRQRRVLLEGDRELIRRFEQLFEFGGPNHSYAGLAEPATLSQ